MKTIDKLKEKLLCNPKIKMMAFNFPQGTNNMSSLSDILEEHPDQKYFLSEHMVKRLMSYRDTSVTPLQGGTRVHRQSERTLVKVNSMHKSVNGRAETI
jgi:uncharacterized protein (DUF2236 family)